MWRRFSDARMRRKSERDRPPQIPSKCRRVGPRPRQFYVLLTLTVGILFTLSRSFHKIPSLPSVHQKKNSSRNKRVLSFVHIPKTAGSSIEGLGFEGRLTDEQMQHWGLFTFCNPLRLRKSVARWWMNCNRETENTCVPWHNPEKLHSLYDNNDEVTTFCVIRNPLDRLLSIFKYNNGQGRKICTVTAFNRWTENIIHRLKNDEAPPMMCHLLQQTSYPCERKLLFENLATEFDALMAEFGMNITLSDSNAIHERSSKTCGNLKASDLFPKVHTLVSKHYASDLSLHTKLLEEKSMGRSVENSFKPKNNSVASAKNTS
uniref:Uncharacterized protein n=1 Tax=Corethron hystrix TaxID=216773 RepID=A0A7S1BA71_9STRA|mmetsp:Transcript_18356/g.42001  ORF Transcript_18356/g.42001 Transcript_18356/m.42001 type:complete len:318 (+) Transcript_18356:145-1098(+)